MVRRESALQCVHLVVDGNREELKGCREHRRPDRLPGRRRVRGGGQRGGELAGSAAGTMLLRPQAYLLADLVR